MITRSYVATLLQSRCDAAHHGAPPLRLLPLRSRFLFVLLQGKRLGALVCCARVAVSRLARCGAVALRRPQHAQAPRARARTRTCLTQR